MFHDSSARIVEGLQAWISAAAPGAQLPSTRALVAQYGASPVTVQRALRTLSLQGLIETRTGVGTFVRRVPAARPNDFGWQTAALGPLRSRYPSSAEALRSVPNDVIALHSGYPDRELLPERLLRAALVRASRGDAATDRPPAAGLPQLQAWFASELGTSAPAGTPAPTPSDTTIVPGSQSGLVASFRGLVGAGQPLLIESPTYWGAMLAASQAGVELVPVTTSNHGPDLEELDRALAQSGARAFYAQPNFANPTGGQWSPATADAVLELVRHHGAFLIEDDWAHDFGIDADSRPIAARDQDGHVVYLRSLTKSVSPAFRVAAVIARGPARDRILADVQAHAMYVSPILQAAALDVVTQPGWRTHLRNLRSQLATRRDLLVNGLREHAPTTHVDAPSGGLNAWVRLPDRTDLHDLARRCENEGTIVAAGDAWFPAEPTGPYLRLNFSGPNPSAFPQAARIIGAALEAPS